MGRLINNWPDKLLALAVSLMLFFYQKEQQNMVRSTLVLPLAVTSAAGQRIVEPLPGTQVRVDLEGPADAIHELDSQDSGDVKVSVDTTALRPGVPLRLQITVDIPEKFRKRGVDVIRWVPSTVQAKAITDASKELPIVAKALNHPDGWQLIAAPEVTPSRATVTGLQSDIDRVVTVVAPFEMESKEKIGATAILEALDSNNISVMEVRVAPVEAQVTGVQERVVLQRQLPVQPIFRYPVGAHVSVTVDPPRVTAVGPEKTLRGVYGIETEPFELPAGATQFTKDAALVVPRDGVTLQIQRVKVIVHVQALSPHLGHSGKPLH